MNKPGERIRYQRRFKHHPRWTYGLGTITFVYEGGNLDVDSDSGAFVHLVAGDDDWHDVDIKAPKSHP